MPAAQRLESILRPSGWETSRFIEGRTAPKDERVLKQLAQAIEHPNVDSSYTARQAALATGLGIAGVVQGCASVGFGSSIGLPSYAPIKSDYQDILDIDGNRRTQGPHDGVDIVVSKGSPVIAAADGKVILSTFEERSGNRIFIYHGQDTDGKHVYSFYGHMEKRLVNTGNSIKRGQQIGTVGNTGWDMPKSKTPHLHFSVVVSPTSWYTINGPLANIDRWALANPKDYWLINDGKIETFVEGKEYTTTGVKFIYPVPPTKTR